MISLTKLKVMATTRASLTGLLATAVRDIEAGIQLSQQEQALEYSVKEARRAIESLIDALRLSDRKAVTLREGNDGEEHYRTIAKMVPEGCVVAKLLVLSDGLAHDVETLDEMRALCARTDTQMPKPRYYLCYGPIEALVAQLSAPEYCDAKLLQVF